GPLEGPPGPLGADRRRRSGRVPGACAVAARPAHRGGVRTPAEGARRRGFRHAREGESGVERPGEGGGTALAESAGGQPFHRSPQADRAASGRLLQQGQGAEKPASDPRRGGVGADRDGRGTPRPGGDCQGAGGSATNSGRPGRSGTPDRQGHAAVSFREWDMTEGVMNARRSIKAGKVLVALLMLSVIGVAAERRDAAADQPPPRRGGAGGGGAKDPA